MNYRNLRDSHCSPKELEIRLGFSLIINYIFNK
jgi:hypothetical protein